MTGGGGACFPVDVMCGTTFVPPTLQAMGASTWFNTLLPVPLGLPGAGDGPRQRFKYGVIDMAALVDDLRNWRSLYIAGRMHKPVRARPAARTPIPASDVCERAHARIPAFAHACLRTCTRPHALVFCTSGRITPTPMPLRQPTMHARTRPRATLVDALLFWLGSAPAPRVCDWPGL